MKTKITLLVIGAILLVFSGYSQMGIGTTAPNGSAMLDVVSSQHGFLAPRMDSTQRKAITSPAYGLLVFDTDTRSYWVFTEDWGWDEIARGGTIWRRYPSKNQVVLMPPAEKVGIGTLNPQATLDVSGSFVFDGGDGDLNDDGLVDNVDAVIAYQYAIGALDLDHGYLARGDVNGDGKVDATDANMIYSEFLGNGTISTLRKNSRNTLHFASWGDTAVMGDETLQLNGMLKMGQQTSPPSSPADHLYNLGGQLYWNTINLTQGGSLPAGTTGKTIRHDGTSWTAVENLFNSGTYIGIGTTLPVSKIHIIGDSKSYGMPSGPTKADPGLYVKAGRGGGLEMQSGGAGYGGELIVDGGSGSSGGIHGGSGGQVILIGGEGGSSGGGNGGTGGNIVLQGGTGADVFGNGGNILLLPGTSLGGGDIGKVGINQSYPEEMLDLNGMMHIAEVDTPSIDENRLYNLGGNLYWSGNNLNEAGFPAGSLGSTLFHNGTDWVSGTNLFNNGNFVGIGSTNPIAKLEILGPNAAAGEDAIPVIKIVGGAGGFGDYPDPAGAGSDVIITAGAGGGAIGSEIGKAGRIMLTGGRGGFKPNDNFGYGGDVIIRGGPDHDDLEVFDGNVILSDLGGLVGIGTSMPMNKLHIAAASNPLRLQGLQTSTQNDVLVVDANGVVSKKNVNLSSYWSLYGNSIFDVVDEFIGTTNDMPLAIRTNNVEQIRILTDGNVGIGKWNPTYKLDVNGNGRFADWRATARLAVELFEGENYALYGENSSYKGGIAYFADMAPQGAGAFGFYGTDVRGYLGFRDPDHTIAVYGMSSTSGNFAGYFQGGKVYISNALGIGTSSPYANLTVTNAGSGYGNVASFAAGTKTLNIGTYAGQGNIAIFTDNGIVEIGDGAAVDGGLMIVNGGGGPDIFLRSGGDSYINQAGNNLGIGTTAPTAQLHSTGGVRFAGLSGTGTLVGIDANGNLSKTTASDSRIGSQTTHYLTKWNGSQMVSGSMYDNGGVGIGTTIPDGMVEIKTSSSLNKQALRIHQQSTNSAFIDFAGTFDNVNPPTSEDFNGNLTTYNSSGGVVVGPKYGAGIGWTFIGMMKVEVNGATYWVPYYQPEGPECPRIDAWIDGQWIMVGRAIQHLNGKSKEGRHDIRLKVPAKRFRLVEDEMEISYVKYIKGDGEDWGKGLVVTTPAPAYGIDGFTLEFEFSKPVTHLETFGYYEFAGEKSDK